VSEVPQQGRIHALALGLNSDYRDTSFIRNGNPPQGHHRDLGIVILQDSRGVRFCERVTPVGLPLRGPSVERARLAPSACPEGMHLRIPAPNSFELMARGGLALNSSLASLY
jgi:hypothetical protein